MGFRNPLTIARSIATNPPGLPRIVMGPAQGLGEQIAFSTEDLGAGQPVSDIRAFTLPSLPSHSELVIEPANSAGLSLLSQASTSSPFGYLTTAELDTDKLVIHGTQAGRPDVDLARRSRSTTGASLGSPGTVDTVPAGCSFALTAELDAGNWLLLATGQCDWSTGTLAPRYRLRLKAGPTVLDEVGMYIGQLTGTAPFAIAAQTVITADTTVSLAVAQTNTGIGGGWNVSGITFAALPIG